MVEFVVAILAIVIVVAGFFQLMEIVGRRGDILRSIRGEAGKKPFPRATSWTGPTTSANGRRETTNSATRQMTNPSAAAFP